MAIADLKDTRSRKTLGKYIRPNQKTIEISGKSPMDGQGFNRSETARLVPMTVVRNNFHCGNPGMITCNPMCQMM